LRGQLRADYILEEFLLFLQTRPISLLLDELLDVHLLDLHLRKEFVDSLLLDVPGRGRGVLVANVDVLILGRLRVDTKL